MRLALIALHAAALNGFAIAQAAEPQCTASVESPFAGRTLTLPAATDFYLPSFRENQVERASQNRPVPKEKVAGRKLTVLCYERAGTGVFAVQVEGVPEARYVNASPLAVLFGTEDRGKQMQDSLMLLTPLIGQTLWSKQTNSGFISQDGDLLRGTVAINNLEAVQVAGASAVTDQYRMPKIALALKTSKGEMVYQHLERSGPTVQVNVMWHTKDPFATYASLSQEDWQNVRAGRYEVGMSETAVRLVMGAPASVNRTRLEGLDLEQHVYPSLVGGKTKYLYYERGNLKVIQD